MLSRIGLLTFRPWQKPAAVLLVAAVCFALASRGWAALESGVYQTFPGATVRENGDHVTNRSRVVPIAATLTFDLSAAPPSLTAFIPNAVLEGGDPFALTVRSSSGVLRTNGTWEFSGDYLRDLYPSGTQYLFDWRFSASTNGEVMWDGITGWAGGHYWQITISHLTIAVPNLDISQSGAQVTLSWSAKFNGYLLEKVSSLPASAWNTVTNPVATTGDRLSVTVEADAAQGFFRLRKF